MPTIKLLIALIVALIFASVGAYASMAREKALKEKMIETLTYDLKITSEGLANLQQENADLGEKLASAENTIESLEDKNKRLDRQKDELEKLAETDPELLKKYSKVYFLSENYAPKRLSEVPAKYVYPEGRKVTFLRDAWKFLEDMLEEAEDDGIDLRTTSGYRSFDEQRSIKDGYRVTYGAGTANQFSAEQGYSEHQIGTAIDLSTPAYGADLTTTFDQSEAYRWLTANAYKYGFILSYPKGNSYYQYEPWHWRFVGRELARDLYRSKQNFYDLDQREIDKYLVEIFD